MLFISGTVELVVGRNSSISESSAQPYAKTFYPASFLKLLLINKTLAPYSTGWENVTPDAKLKIQCPPDDNVGQKQKLGWWCLPSLKTLGCGCMSEISNCNGSKENKRNAS